MNINHKLTLTNETLKQKLHKIYERIPVEELREKPELEKLIFPEPPIVYQIITNFKKTEDIKIPADLDEQKQKKLKSINEFYNQVLVFNKDKDIDIKNKDIKKENKNFINNYHRLIKEKNKFSTGTYIDHDYLIDIANHYNKRGMKIPKLTQDANIFKSNPLILAGSELENYFLYNLGDKYKSKKFLKKIDNVVERKLIGSYILSDEEKRRLAYIIEKEKPKGYLPYKKLINKLKEDIKKTEDTIDNLPKVNDNDEVNIFSGHSRNKKDNNIYDYSTNITNNSGRKRANSLVNFNKFTFRINTSASTKVNMSKRFSLLNPKIVLPEIEYFSKSNATSAISRKKEKKIKSIRIDKNNILSYLKQKLLKNNKLRSILSGYNKINSTSSSDSENNNINIYDNSNNTKKNNNAQFNPNNKRILKRSIKSLNSAGSNSLFSALSNRSNLLNNENDKKKLYNELPMTNIENGSNIELKSNIFKVNEKGKDYEKIKNEEIKRERYNKCESVFNSLLKGNFKSRRCRSVMNDYLKTRGYDPLKKFNLKDNVLNINRIKNKAIDRNFIMEEYKLRNSEKNKAPLTEEQEKIINRHEKIINKLKSNDYIFKKLVIERKIDKESFHP